MSFSLCPEKVFEMLKEVYEGEVTARVVMKRLVMKPIAEALVTRASLMSS